MKAFIAIGLLAVVLSYLEIPPQTGATTSRERYQRNRARTIQATSQVAARPVHVCDVFQTSSSSCLNFGQRLIRDINSQIQIEFEASHAYLEMSSYFSRDDVNYRGLAKFFRAMSDEERGHAIMFMDYLNKRGGRYSSLTIHRSNLTQFEVANPLSAMRKALQMERDVYDSIMNMHWVAQETYDPHFQDFLETEFLTEQVDSIRQLAGYIGVLTRLENDALALHTFDEELYDGER